MKYWVQFQVRTVDLVKIEGQAQLATHHGLTTTRYVEIAADSVEMAEAAVSKHVRRAAIGNGEVIIQAVIPQPYMIIDVEGQIQPPRGC